ncbi:PREDICTED: ribonuclease H At1g65750 [Prunus dulcis]|uniref:PREDICTED: ribonuclease H At1g65750 n=1 Tax=Prunus dulcis TaxID=3755 RepID=A0A5E4FNW9_PRUDU|nr:PREDICTED: ribonuclease H At1g65750 [Prunus dulcis]
MGLPHMVLQLVMSCVQFVHYQICINGELTETFATKNGIRQWDPLSLYLFVLCIDKLSHTIFDTINRVVWKPMKSSQSGLVVSHLFFVDDLVLVAETSPQQAKIMKDYLKDAAQEISNICGSPLTDNLGKYLGVPLLHYGPNKATFNSLLDKVHRRLVGWKGKLFSLAGRAILIKAVTASIPIYPMQTTKLLASVCKELDKLNRNFFWGGNEKKNKIHLCQWNLACRPKSKGGLGFKQTTHMN